MCLAYGSKSASTLQFLGLEVQYFWILLSLPGYLALLKDNLSIFEQTTTDAEKNLHRNEEHGY